MVCLHISGVRVFIYTYTAKPMWQSRFRARTYKIDMPPHCIYVQSTKIRVTEWFNDCVCRCCVSHRIIRVVLKWLVYISAFTFNLRASQSVQYIYVFKYNTHIVNVREFNTAADSNENILFGICPNIKCHMAMCFENPDKTQTLLAHSILYIIYTNKSHIHQDTNTHTHKKLVWARNLHKNGTGMSHSRTTGKY